MDVVEVHDAVDVCIGKVRVVNSWQLVATLSYS